eukprot:gene12903-biopygen12518
MTPTIPKLLGPHGIFTCACSPPPSGGLQTQPWNLGIIISANRARSRLAEAFVGELRLVIHSNDALGAPVTPLLDGRLHRNEKNVPPCMGHPFPRVSDIMFWLVAPGPAQLQGVAVVAAPRRQRTPRGDPGTLEPGRRRRTPWEKRPRTRPGRVPDASHTIEFEETDASRTRPQPFSPGLPRDPRERSLAGSGQLVFMEVWMCPGIALERTDSELSKGRLDHVRRSMNTNWPVPTKSHSWG